MITASIVLYKNDEKEILDVVNSFFSGTVEDKYLFIVDNSPTDELRKVSYRYAQICYIFGHGNVGYGKGHNIAIDKSLNMNSKYHIILNPDVVFGAETIPALISFMNNNPNVGACIPDMSHPDGERAYSSKLLPTPITGIFRRFFKNSNLTKRMNAEFHLMDADHSKVLDVPSISGCFMFLRLSVIQEIGMFDERFFMYYEDVDLSRRIRKKYRVCLCPTAKAVHAGRKEAYKSRTMMKIMLRSYIMYFNKYHWIFDFEARKMNKETLRNISRLN